MESNSIYSTVVHICMGKHSSKCVCFLLPSEWNNIHLKSNIGHDDVIKWKHFSRYCPFVRGIHRSPVNSPHKGQWRGALMGFFIMRLNKRLSTQSWGWWFATPSRPLWRHSNGECSHHKDYELWRKLNNDKRNHNTVHVHSISATW